MITVLKTRKKDGHHRVHSVCGTCYTEHGPCCTEHGSCYTEHGIREQFGVSINVCRLAGDSLNITCKFLYCNHQVHRDFMITLYFKHNCCQLQIILQDVELCKSCFTIRCSL
jgi:hypothetical protein